jgi:excisionase family DNA binding protein
MELLTVEDTAQMLRVSEVTVRRFIANGKLPAVKVGKWVRVRREAVEQLAQPVEPQAVKSKRASRAGRPMTFDDPLFELIGSVTNAPPTDSSRKYEYLANAIAPRPR